MKDSIERLLYIALVLLFILTGISGYFLALQLHSANASQKAIKAIVEQIKTNQDSGNKQIIDHLDCIVLFLSQTDRANIRIQDLQGCKLATEAGAESVNPMGSQPVSNGSAGVTNTPPAEQQPAPPKREPPMQGIINTLNRILKDLGL